MTKLFSVFNLVFMVGLAKTGSWYFDSSKGERRHILFYIGIIELLETKDKALSIVIAPFSITVGIKK